MVDLDRLSAAYETARCDLLAESVTAGHWVGQPSSSPLATAAALAALSIVERHAPTLAGRFADEPRECRLLELIMRSVRWLAKHQNADGGWGDTIDTPSNPAATMLVRAAFALTCVPAGSPALLEKADAYLKTQGGWRALVRRDGKDQGLAAPILAAGALAGLVPWRKVPALPFELVCLPPSTWRFLPLRVASYAIPALVAVGQARYMHRKPRRPVARLLRSAALQKSSQVLADLQPESGGFLQSTPMTSFVVMCLASIDQSELPVVRRGVEFLLASVRPDGSWPLQSNLSIRNTTQAVAALAAAGEDVRELGGLDWLLACQHHQPSPLPLTPAGGWGWTDLAGGLAHADDTAGALVALAAWSKSDVTEAQAERITTAAIDGLQWLLSMQNTDGGWPTFCRGWNRLPQDRSAADLTAHALRALSSWRNSALLGLADKSDSRLDLSTRLDAAMEAGFRFLASQQQADGSWPALWFGNPYRPRQENPIYGTARVLAAYRDCERLTSPAAQRGLDWLAAMQRPDRSWSAVISTNASACTPPLMSIEETALATEALFTCGQSAAHERAAEAGLNWLIDAVEGNRHQATAPVGLHFGKLWYHEQLYPLIMTTSALGQAARGLLPRSAAPTEFHTAKS